MNKIKVLIVDDSVFMRNAIAKILDDNEIEIVGTATNGKDGVEKSIELKTDIITMDIEMPVMTGLEALKAIMKKNPTPVIMVSTLTSEGAEATIEALSNGAVDFITKKAAFKEMDSLKEELTSKIKDIAKSTGLRNQLNRRKLLHRMAPVDTPEMKKDSALLIKAEEIKKYNLKPIRKLTPTNVKAINIGISTGGPEALKNLIPFLPADLPVPVFVEQHMPHGFTKSLSERLNSISSIKVKEAEDSEAVAPGIVYIAPGNRHLLLNKRKRIIISEKQENTVYMPSVDVTMRSLMDIYGRDILGVIMTGMGNDGAAGYAALSSLGGYIIAQDIDSCIVAGMVKAVLANGSANEILTPLNIAKSICTVFGLQMPKLN